MLCLPPFFYASSAENLTSSCKIADPIKYLLFDGDTKTGMNVENGTTISFEASKPIRGLYLVWDGPHTKWDVVSQQNGKETRKTFGENGFLEDYADLGEDYASVTLEFYGAGAILCDIYAFSEGEVPDWVHVWQPPLEKADLLVLPARAGDEFLYFGGAIPDCNAMGKSIQIAYMTNLYNEPLKTHEVLNALYSLGLRAYPVISDFPEITAASMDSALEQYDEDEFLAFTTELLRRFKPEVVIGQGEYGDGVQMLSSNALMIAAELSGDMLEYRESSDKYGVWDVPKVYLHGYDENTPENTISMPWDYAVEMAEQAFSKYSWRQNRSIATDGAYDCRKFSLFRTTVGPDVKKNDLFENIGPVLQNEPETEQQPQAEQRQLEQQQPQTKQPPQTKPVQSDLNPLNKIGFDISISSPVLMLTSAALMIITAFLLRLGKD